MGFWRKHGSGNINLIRVYEIYATKENVSNIHYAEKICSLESDKDCQNADSIKAKITSLYSDAQDQDRIQKFVKAFKAASTMEQKFSFPNIRAALNTLNHTLENIQEICWDVSEVTTEQEYKNKTFGDAGLLLNIGKAIACVVCGVMI